MLFIFRNEWQFLGKQGDEFRICSGMKVIPASCYCNVPSYWYFRYWLIYTAIDIQVIVMYCYCYCHTIIPKKPTAQYTRKMNCLFHYDYIIPESELFSLRYELIAVLIKPILLLLHPMYWVLIYIRLLIVYKLLLLDWSSS